MKQFIVFLSLFVSISLQAQVTIVDFEDDGNGKPDCNPTAEWVTDPNVPVITVLPNPDKTGINATDTCVQFIETMSSAPGNSLQLAFNGSTSKTGHNLSANKYVQLMVYSADQTNFDITLELGAGGTPHFAMTKSISTTLNTWTEVEFDFSGNDTSATINNANGWVSNIRIHFNNGTAGAGDTYYVDQYVITPTSSIPVPMPVMIADFEDDGNGKPDCFPNAEWPNDPNVPVVTILPNPDKTGINATDTCVQFVETMSSAPGNSLQLAFTGATSKTGHDLVANKYVRFMVYSVDQTDFDITLELGAGGTPHFAMTKAISVTLNTWTEIEFDFSGNDTSATINNAGGWVSNVRIHFNNGTTGSGDTYYVDQYGTSPTALPPPPPTSLIIVDFEDDGNGKPDCFPTAEWPNDPNVPVVTVLPNPDKTGINATDTCVQFVETMSSAPGNSLQLAFTGATSKTGHDLVANKYVRFMVYSADQTDFDITLELGAGGTPHFAMTKSISTSLNTWTEIEFDFSGNDTSAVINNAAGWVSNVRIHFNNGTTGSGDTYYVDQYLISSTATPVSGATFPATLTLSNPLEIPYEVSNGLYKMLDVSLTTAGNYANFTLYADSVVIADNLDVPKAGTFEHHVLVKFPQLGPVQLKLVASGSDMVVDSFMLSDYSGVTFPDFTNETDNADIVDEKSLKYGGPSIADIDNDGDYDLVLNNHNDSPSKLYWNDGDGTFTKQSKDLSLWNLMDLHGSAAGDYDNDGDLDIILALGGGNGTNPAPPILYRNDDGVMVRSAATAGITTGARGRTPRWSDMDLDGDLDLMLFNAAGINGSGGQQHIFYENVGNGQFQLKRIANLDTRGGEKVLITDFNGDNIDDIILFSPISVWTGNGNFTFTHASNTWLPFGVHGSGNIIAAADIDIDNDGDLDIYLSKGEYYFTVAEQNSADFNPTTNKLDMRISGSKGTLPFEFTANGSIVISGLDHVRRNNYNGGYPLYLGSALLQDSLKHVDSSLVITQAMASGWSATRSNNGLYIGHVGGGVWKMESVRDTNIYWSIQFSIDSLTSFTPTGWTPNNRNVQDVLLRNDGTKFTNVSEEWNIPIGGNHWGVTRGDFNNDGNEDLYVHRFGYLKNRLSDYIMMNTGQGSFEISTSHAANNAGSRDHGDMGQAFDYDLDGQVDVLNGDDEFGLWHLYKNAGTANTNYSLVNVGYSPKKAVDAISATVRLVTPTQTYSKRVGSAGEAHSQSLLNIVHFGLGQESQIDSVIIRWRNGETFIITDTTANQVLVTPHVNVSVEGSLGSIQGQLGRLYPNPTQDGQVNLVFHAPVAKELSIAMYDATGKLLTQQFKQVAQGKQTLSFDFSAYSSGMYLVRISDGESFVSRKLVLEKR